MAVRSGYIPINDERTVNDQSQIPLISARLVQTPPPPTTTRWKPLTTQVLNLSNSRAIEIVPTLVGGW